MILKKHWFACQIALWMLKNIGQGRIGVGMKWYDVCW